MRKTSLVVALIVESVRITSLVRIDSARKRLLFNSLGGGKLAPPGTDKLILRLSLIG